MSAYPDDRFAAALDRYVSTLVADAHVVQVDHSQRSVDMATLDYVQLDPGIRDIVRKLRDAGFETSDSGDGVSKPADWYESGEAIPFPHVVARTTALSMVQDAERMARVLGDGWNVEACYNTLDKTTTLFARTLDPRELA